ncbi:MAG TPA: nucleotidyltransferase domain-containing protein [Gemmatimonadales bacterium]|nr:nucleotidyltransferase domain-containing protein [Gemmatimonadales bacterium]
MPLVRVTLTLPPDLVKLADRAARRLSASRSSVVAQALRAHLGQPEPRPAAPGRVAEPTSAQYAGRRPPALRNVTSGALLEELRRRLGSPAAGRGVTSEAAGAGLKLSYDRQQLADLCRRHHIRRLSLFGSVLRDDFGPESDVDVLVEFEPGHTPGLAITDIEDQLSALFGGRRVDLVTERSLHRLIRDDVLASAVPQYAA